MTIKVTVSLPKDLAKFADEFAAQTHRSRSRVFADLLAEKRDKVVRDALIKGYQALAEDTLKFTNEAMPLASEVWEQE